jgi:gp16 family phage-associated protein
VLNIPQNIHSVKLVRAVFEDSGISVAEWARARGFSTSLVYQVLEGRRKCLRGQSHQIAVALGIKKGSIVSVQELIARLG